MFASNGKISIRQIKRLMLFNIFGISSLMLPQMLAAESGLDGATAILVFNDAVQVSYIYKAGKPNPANYRKAMEQMGTDYYGYLKSAFGRVGSDLCCIFYFFYSVCLSGFAAYSICQIIVKHLLRDESFALVLLVLLVTGAYGVYGGLECRGRVYEILFTLLAVLLFLMLALSISNVEPDRLSPVFYSDGMAFLKSSYLSFGFFSLIFFVLFLKPYCVGKEKLSAAMGKILFLLGILLCVIYLILTGVFGSRALADIPAAIITLMSMVEIPGGFLERLDAAMVGLWFFAIYALMDNTIFYAVDIFMNTLKVGRKRYPALLTLFLVYAVAAECQNSIFFLNLLKQLFCYVGIPLVVLIPLLAWGRMKGGKRDEEKNLDTTFVRNFTVFRRVRQQ